MKKIKLYAILLVFGLLGKTAYPQASPDVIENVLSSVVTVAIFKTDIVKTPLGFRGETAPDVAYEKALEMSGSQSSGSGFIIEVDGTKYVITNAHVVQDASQDPGSIYIFSVNQTKYEMRLKGGDSFFDIAVLEFVDEPGDEITTVKFKKDEPRIGENVYAIGNPLGTYPYTVTDGIISAKNRMREGNTGKFGYLQSTATIIWGNSGGPLIDQNGDVAGVNTKIAFATAPSGEQVLQSQLNFALEAKIAERLVNEIIKNDGFVNRSFLGIEVSQRYKYVSYGRNSQFILVDERPKISGIIPNSPAYEKLVNFENYDILEINGFEVRNVEEALGEFEKVKPGDNVTLKLKRGNDLQTVTIESIPLGEKEQESIALFVLNPNSFIKIVDGMPQLMVNYNESGSYRYDENTFKKTSSPATDASSQKYFVLAAGIVGDNYQNMWRTDQLKDMGGVLKISGLSGVIDLYLLEPGGTVDDIKVMRHYLSGNDKIYKSSLWY